MDNGASSSTNDPSLLAHRSAVSASDDILASPTYLEPPPTYHHATELSGSSTEEENIPKRKRTKSYRSETIISTTTTTTTTSMTSLTTRPNSAAPGPSRLSSSKLRSKSTDSLLSVTSKSSDPYLDALLARSVAALELSNALLQSTLTTQSTLSSVLASDEALEKRERAFEERLLRSANPSFRGESSLAIEQREGKKMEWMREMEGIVRDVEALFDVPSPPPPRQRRSTLDSQKEPKEGGLVFGDHSSRTRSPPPRALTQYVSISGANANASAGEATAGKHEIYLPSTTGLRRGPHREALGTSRSPSSSGGRYLRPGHSPSNSASSAGEYLSPIPATHPEALPLSPQELLELHSESGSPTKAAAPEINDRHAYLRRFGAHSRASGSTSSTGLETSASAGSTLSRTAPTRPTLTPFQPASTGLSHAQTPTTAGFTFPSNSAQESDHESPRRRALAHTDHSRTASSATSNSIASSASIVSVPYSRRSSRSSTRSGLSITAGLPFSLSLPLPSSIGAALRKSPSLRGFGSPASTEGSEAGEGYSPALEAIGDFGEEGDDDFGDIRGRNPSIKSPTRGRAILKGRFRTADTLRRILDTSPSPLSRPKPAPILSPVDKGKSVARNIAPNARSNTDSSSRTITRSMRDSFASAESLALAIPTSYTLATSKAAMHSASDIHAILSSRSFISAHSPSTVSSTSDLHSSDLDRRDHGVKRRLSLRPAPRFMPRTPSGRVAQLEVSGATARAPMMHAHLVDLESPSAVSEDTPVADFNLAPTLEAQSYVTDKSSSKLPETGTPERDQERRRTQSLSTSVSSVIGQARALESVKLASAGKVKGGSNLKGSPAWQAQRKLVDHASLDGGSSLPHSPSIHGESVGGASGSKRTSWIGAGLVGLGLAITPSSSGANSPPMRVSFAKEPVRYSEERERSPIEDDEDDEDEEAEVNTKDLDAEVDGSLTIKPRSIRRTKSWNGSVKGVGSRRVPSKRRSKVEKQEKEGWLEWFLTATTAGGGTGPGHMGISTNSMGIGREEMFESRTRDEW